jgi:hypothetical protein
MSPEITTLSTPAGETSRWKILYRKRPAWLIGEDERDRDQRVRLSDFAVKAPDEAHYPGDYAGFVVSVIPAYRDFSPGELVDPNRAVVELDLTDDERADLASGVSRIVHGAAPLLARRAVTFDEQHGAIAAELKRRFPLDFLVREREEEEAVLEVDARNAQAKADWDAEVDSWSASAVEAAELELVFETPKPIMPKLEPLPEPEFAPLATRLTKSLPQTVVHSGAGLYKVDSSGSAHNDTMISAVKDNGTSTVTLSGGITRDCTGEILTVNGNSYPIKSKTDDTHLVVVGDASGEGGGNDANTNLLLHCDGADGSTSFPDSSNAAPTHVVTAGGNAEVDTAQKKFGTGSAIFGGVVTADLTNPIGFCARYKDAVTYWDFFRHVTNKVTFRVVSGATVVYVDSNAWVPLVDTWYHIALVRNGNDWYIFINGVDQTSGGSPDASAVPNVGTALLIGGYTTTVQKPITGWIDEFRVSDVARWTSAFTPPGTAYGTTVPCSIAPYTTIQSALDQLWTDQGGTDFAAEQEIRIYDGTYTECVTLNSGLRPTGSYALRIAVASGNTSVVIANTGLADHTLDVNGVDSVHIIGITVETDVASKWAVRFNGATAPFVDDCTIDASSTTGSGVHYPKAGRFRDTTIKANANTLFGAQYILDCLFEGCVIQDCKLWMLYQGSTAFKACIFDNVNATITATATGPVSARPLRAVNCTAYNCPDLFDLDDPGASHAVANIVSRNNIFHTCTSVYKASGTGRHHIEADRNCYYNCTHIAQIAGSDYDSLAAWQAYSDDDGTSPDANSLETDPLMTAPATDDFSLQTTSPCWNVGRGAGVTTDYLGSVMDEAFPQIGAWSPGALVKTAPAVAVTISGTTVTVTLTGSAHSYRVRLSTADGVEEAASSRTGAGDVVFTSVAVGVHSITAWSVTGDGETLGEHSVILNVEVADTSAQTFERIANTVRGRFKAQVADAAPWGSVVAKTTVSALASDGSFNDSVEDLSVFVARQQVLVSGFTNGGNNGYFTVVSATANKLVVSGGSTIVDEVAGQSVTIMSALPTQYDNDASFDRPVGAPWCRFTVLQGDTRQVSCGGAKRFRLPGVAVAQLFIPIGEGDKRGLELADDVNVAFRSLTASGVKFMSPSVQNMGRQEGEWQLNVSCPFFADDLV